MILNRVREARLNAGLTQEQLAERCGVSRQTIIALEKNGYELSLGFALRICRELGAPTEALFELVGPDEGTHQLEHQ